MEGGRGPERIGRGSCAGRSWRRNPSLSKRLTIGGADTLACDWLLPKLGWKMGVSALTGRVVRPGAFRPSGVIRAPLLRPCGGAAALDVSA